MEGKVYRVLIEQKQVEYDYIYIKAKSKDEAEELVNEYLTEYGWYELVDLMNCGDYTEHNVGDIEFVEHPDDSVEILNQTNILMDV